MTKRTISSKTKKFKDLNSVRQKKRTQVHTPGVGTGSGASTNPRRLLPKDGFKSFYRTPAKIRLLNLYNSEPKDDRDVVPTKAAKLNPDRRWFGNTRVVSQAEIMELKSEIDKYKSDPYTVVINKRKLPMSLLKDDTEEKKIHILDVEKFEDTFGPKSRRKKPKLESDTLEELAKRAEQKAINYVAPSATIHDGGKELSKDKMLEAGQSKRIWEELYKVIDASDVIVEVIDARDPMGTRSKHVESHIKNNCPHKFLVLVLNKCDLIPKWALAKWVRILSKEHPTIAFRASVEKPFGKNSLFQVLRQLDTMHKDKKNISVGFIGYPNVGKSSVINTLKKRACCKVAPIPGETKVWQYVTLTRRIYLIDSPGVVYEEGSTPEEIVLKGVVRAEKLDNPEQYIGYLLQRVNKSVITSVYDINDWEDSEDFLNKLAQKSGKLKKGGEANLNQVASMVITDFQRSKINWYIPPPEDADEMNNKKEEKKKESESNDEKKEENKKEEVVKSSS